MNVKSSIIIVQVEYCVLTVTVQRFLFTFLILSGRFIGTTEFKTRCKY